MKSQQLTWPEQHGKRTEGLDLHESCTVAPEIEQIKFTGKIMWPKQHRRQPK
jgi:hypothetical protein